VSVQAVSSATHLDVPLDDVCEGALFFRRVLAVPVHLHDRDHADVDLAPGLVAHLRTTRPRTEQLPDDEPGVVIELRVPDLRGALTELRRRGADVLIEPVLTEWGTESAFIAGPDGVVIELYHPYPD